MVYYHTSGNVRMLRNIIIDYGAANEVSPYEYMKTYIEKCPETIDDTKLSWVAETFLSFNRHGSFLREVASHLSEELSEDDQDHFMILFHAVTFQIEPKDVQLLYKCLFNLSKPLLNTFTKFLSNNEVLTFISQVAQASYDTYFITENIIRPLFEWQPYISDIAHTYAEYMKKIMSRKLKPPTVPIQPNVLNRKGKDIAVSPVQPSLPPTPPNSVHKKKRMLTKTAIDQKLKQNHEKNKQRAARLLNDVKNQNFHFAQVKSVHNKLRPSGVRDEIEIEFAKAPPKPKQTFVLKSTPHVKENAATVKRISRRMQLVEEAEVQWLQNIMQCKNTSKIDEIIEYDRQERERKRLLDIEKKHLMGLITYEEAVLAKKKFQEENKKKYEEFLKEKESWVEEIERWRKIKIEENRKHVEKLSMIELNILQAKNDVATKKKETADKLKKESETIMAKVMKTQQEELERRIKMIKEIKILAMIAKTAKVPKIIDLTETSGLGLLCEMSLAELQERISVMKIGLKEELEKKRTLIIDENKAAKQNLEETKSNIKNYMNERAVIRKHNKKSNLTIDTSSSKEISDLKKVLEEKRKMRLQMSN